MFTTLLTARSEEQLSSVLLAFNTFLETPGLVSFDGRNITVERSCLRDVNVLDLPPGTGDDFCRMGDPVCWRVNIWIWLS